MRGLGLVQTTVIRGTPLAGGGIIGGIVVEGPAGTPRTTPIAYNDLIRSRPYARPSVLSPASSPIVGVPLTASPYVGAAATDPTTGLPIDPRSGLPFDPRTGMFINPSTGAPYGSAPNTPSVAGPTAVAQEAASLPSSFLDTSGSISVGGASIPTVWLLIAGAAIAGAVLFGRRR